MNLFALRLSVAAMLSASLIGCASNAPSNSAPAVNADISASKPATSATLQGMVSTGEAASVKVFDAMGKSAAFKTDAKGNYSFAADGLTPPLMLVADVAGKQYVSLIANPSGSTTAHINALTDYIASGVAKNAKFEGPVGMVESGKAPAVSAEDLKSKAASLQVLIGGALKEAGVANAASFDPASDSAGDLLKLIRSNRGYISSKGVLGTTSLYDYNYHEISKESPLHLAHTKAEYAAINATGVTRVFIAGDSTASNYDVDVLPRTGWGQIFDRQFKDAKQVQVVNVAQSGRSSRSFITEGWFDLIKAEIRKGDYLLVQFGHNDEKCGNEPPRPNSRDVIDIANLCTYPGTPTGVADEMSFQKSLEKYIAIAKNAGATPVLITPLTRRKFSNGAITETTHTYGKGKFPGDYSQTIRDTAKANKVALIDLDVKSMEFFSKIGEEGSLDYFLAVDPAKYPYYAKRTGRIDKPDNTHLQEKGAEAIGGIVAGGLKEARLPVAKLLK